VRILRNLIFYIQIVDTLELLIFQMLIGQDHPLIGDLPQAFACFLEEILCKKKEKSRVWCHNLVQSQSIMYWRK